MDDRSATASPHGRLLLALTATMRHLKRRSGEEGLDPAGFVVLHHVRCSAGGRVSDLAQSLGLDASTVSRHIKNLESGGFLERSADPADRRASRISLTDRGSRVLAAAYEARTGLLRAATEGWSERELGTLLSLLEQLAEDVDLVDGPMTVEPSPQAQTV